MALDKLFCPIRSSKSSKSRKSTANQATSRNNDNSHQNNIPANNNEQHISIPYRYVTVSFRAQASDEISVSPGDVVLYEYADISGDWIHVLCFKSHQSGYVPREILSLEPPKNIQCKKLPRSIADPMSHHHSHSHKALHHLSGGHSSTDDNQARLQPCDTTRFGPAHSLHGSSGQQSIQKYPDLRNIGSHGYYNLRASDPHYDRSEMEFTQFHRRDYGTYVALHNFVGREERDLNINPGEYITVLNKDDPDWYWVQRHDDFKEGFVPSKFICDYEQVKSYLNKGNSTVTMKSLNPLDFHTYINHRPEQDSLQMDQQSLFQNL